MKTSYAIIGKEVGEQGTPHLQCYLEFDNAMRFSTLQSKLLKRCHLEVRMSTAQKAADYCKKEENFEEWGELSRQGKRNDLVQVKELIEDGATMRDIIQEATSGQSIKLAQNILPYLETPRDTKPYVIYCYGASGLCKTRIAYLDNPGISIHKQAADETKWWQGYDSQPVTIIDEFRAQIKWDRMLELLDFYPCVVECKGGARQFKSAKVYITSPYDVSHWYNDVFEQKYQLWRRIDEVWYFEKKNLGICISKYAQTFNDEAQHWTQTFELQEEEQRFKSGEKVCSESNAEGGDEKVDCVL